MNVIFIHEENNYDLLIYEIIHTYDERICQAEISKLTALRAVLSSYLWRALNE
jgi:hypothetical protein